MQHKCILKKKLTKAAFITQIWKFLHNSLEHALDCYYFKFNKSANYLLASYVWQKALHTECGSTETTDSVQ